jgi:hypothetical protein
MKSAPTFSRIRQFAAPHVPRTALPKRFCNPSLSIGAVNLKKRPGKIGFIQRPPRAAEHRNRFIKHP